MAPRSGRSAVEEAENRSGVAKHLFKTATHPISEFMNLPRGRQLGYLYKPQAFAWWGIQKQIEVIEMNYEYFIGCPTLTPSTMIGR